MGLKDYRDNPWIEGLVLKESVKSMNQCKSVIQTVYDIVKAHGGELKVETKEEEGSEVVIQLPA